jgi:hypothetical protein
MTSWLVKFTIMRKRNQGIPERAAKESSQQSNATTPLLRENPAATGTPIAFGTS